MKTVLAPGAPWPKAEKPEPVVKPKPKPKPKPKKPKLKPIELDFFKTAHEQLASGTARGAMRKGGNRNAVNPRNSVHGKKPERAL